MRKIIISLGNDWSSKLLKSLGNFFWGHPVRTERHVYKVESEAQSVVANIRIYEGILMNVPAVLYCFLAGGQHDSLHSA